MTYDARQRYVIDCCIRIMREAIDGLDKDPASLDYWHQVRHSLNTIAAVNLDINPKHYGDTNANPDQDQC